MSDIAAQSIALSLGVSSLVTYACRRVRIPAPLALLSVGLCLGSSGLGLIDGDSLGSALKGFITVAIGLLIFEGALHLNREELSRAPRAVWGLLSIGAVVTWVVATLAARVLLEMQWPTAILLGATLIVTGPTVVQPILRLIRVSPRVHAALSAEAVLIDPLGVVATITTLEVLRQYIVNGLEFRLAGEGLLLFLKPLIGGAGVGVAMGVLGYGLLQMIHRRGKADPQLLNLVGIGVCMTCVGIGEAVTPEAGLASVTICGIIMARARVLGATELRAFKELLATILVGTLFMLLASRFQVAQLRTLTWSDGMFVACLILVVRPLCVAVSTIRSRLNVSERVFAMTFAPRGIVALSVASVAEAELMATLRGASGPLTPSMYEALARDAGRLELLMFTTIVVTVLLAAAISPLLVRILKVGAGKGNAVVLVGAHALSMALARALAAHGVHARIIESNPVRAAECTSIQLDVVVGDATNTRWLDDVASPHDTGWVIAWTGNDTVDQVVARWGDERYGPRHAALWSNKPAREGAQLIDWGAEVKLSQVLGQIERRETSVVEADSPASLSKLLAYVDGSVVTLAAGFGAGPLEQKGRRYIGLAPALT
jgi:NhaP-type Na+/H+ or K+/H+ antiporter